MVCFKHRALIPNHSFCKSTQYPRSKKPVTRVVLSSVNSQEEKISVSSPRLASGNSLRRNIQDFESLSETIRLTRVCEDTIFVHQVASGMSYETRPDEDDGFVQLIPLCREFSFLEKNSNSEPLQQFLEEQLLDQALKFRL